MYKLNPNFVYNFNEPKSELSFIDLENDDDIYFLVEGQLSKVCFDFLEGKDLDKLKSIFADDEKTEIDNFFDHLLNEKILMK